MDAPDLLVGLGHPDDAAVWKLDDERALVVTTDFFTPVVDTPYEYGSIAAANSISDIYAMGGEPFLALNVGAFPASLPTHMISEVLRGGAEKAKEAGVIIAGGHTIQDNEPKYGLIVLGFVNPQQMISKVGAKTGDQLVLTKPLGVGVTTTAIKRGIVTHAEINTVVRLASTLNNNAALAAKAAGVRGGTDVTGFGFLGHAAEMATGSGVRFEIDFNRMPILESGLKYSAPEIWAFAGGAFDNKLHFGPQVDTSALSEQEEMLLYDPQTSGGLLLAVTEEGMAAFQAKAADLGQEYWQVGQVTAGEGIIVGK